MNPPAGWSEITRSKIIWVLSTGVNSSQSCFFASAWDCTSNLRSATKSLHGNNATILCQQFTSFRLTLQPQSKRKKSVNFATSTVLNSPQTSGWIVSNPEIPYLSTISHYLSVSISLFGQEGILFSTLTAWSLNGDCQQLGTCFLPSQLCPCFSAQHSNRLHWENVYKIRLRVGLQLYSVQKKSEEKEKVGIRYLMIS